MEDSVLPITKEMFISIKKENINTYYEVIAKVLLGSYVGIRKGRLRDCLQGPPQRHRRPMESD
jgi:hypothetical protein